MADKRTRSVIVIEVNQPNEILGTDVQKKDEMESLMKDNMNSVVSHGSPRIVMNGIYAMNENGLWKRVRYIGPHELNNYVKVSYLDYGCNGVTLERRLKALPEHLKTIPSIGREYVIPRLVPLETATRITKDFSCPVKVEPRRSRNWSSAALTNIKQLLQDCDLKVEIEELERENGNGRSSNGKIYCNIYVRIGNSPSLTSIADVLVNEKFAVFTQKCNGTVNGSNESSNFASSGLSYHNGTVQPAVERISSSRASSERRSVSPLASNDSSRRSRMHSSSEASSEETYQNSQIHYNDPENPDHSDQLDGEAMKRAVFAYHAVPIPPPFLSYEKSPLPLPIKRCLTKRNVKCFLFVQANMFPVILRNMDMVAVAPQRKGKTTGLLMSLLTRLSLLMEDPSAMKKGTGPIAIIICASWSKVDKCAGYARKFLTSYPSQAFRSIRMVSAYGGDDEARTEIRLMEGCELLVITAPYLLRLLNKNNLVELTRLESLAFDDMDVLAEKYLKEIKEIFLYTQRNRERKRNHQVIATASTWTQAIFSFTQVRDLGIGIEELTLTNAIFKSCLEFPYVRPVAILARHVINYPRLYDHELMVFDEVGTNNERIAAVPFFEILAGIVNINIPVHLFNRVCMHQAVEIYSLGSILDACVRLKIPHYVIPWSGNKLKDRVRALTAFLRETSTEKDSVVVCTSIPHSGRLIYEYLKEELAWKEIMYIGDDYVSEKEVNRLCARWDMHKQSSSMKKPVLVLVDSKETKNLTITDANILVHYDLPAKVDSFYRYYLIRSGMEKKNDDQRNNYRCYFLCNEQEWSEVSINPKESLDKVYDTIRYLEKLQVNIPINLKVIARKRRITMEMSKGYSSLCHGLRAFGICRHPSCDGRHLIIGEIDKPQLPNTGEIHFKVLYLKSANHFFVRIIEHRGTNGEVTEEYEDNLIQLHTDINAFYSRPENQRVLADSALINGAIVGVQDESETQFRRARVLNIKKKKGQTRVRIHYIDEGRFENVHKSRLLEMPASLVNIASQAVECFVCSCQPIDEDTEFTPEATELVGKLLGERTFFGKIRLCLGRTIWMNNVAEHVYHRETQVHVVDHNIRSVLLEKKLGINNPTHLPNLIDMCKGELNVPDPKRKDKFLSRRFTYNNAPVVSSSLDDDVTEALVGGSVETPQIFYIIRQDLYDELWNLCDEISEHWKYTGRFKTNELEPGTFVLCLFTKGNEWNRGKIIEKVKSSNEDDISNCPTYRVLFIDFGDIVSVSMENIRQLPSEFRQFPAAAIECSLANCQPANVGRFSTLSCNEEEGTTWSDDAEEALMDFFYDGNCRQPLDVTVISRRESQIDPTQFHYVVKIVQQQLELDLTYHLIAEGYALGDVDFAERLFPIGKQDDRISPFARQTSLIHLAFDLLKCVDNSRRFALARSLYNVVVNWDIQQPSIRKKYKVQDRINILAKLINYTYRMEELYFLYRAFVYLLAKDEAVLEFDSEDESVSVSYVVFHSQRLCDVKKYSITQLQREELLHAIGVIFKRILKHPSVNSLTRIPQWISAITGPIVARVSTHITAQFIELASEVLTLSETKSCATDVIDCLIQIFDPIDIYSVEWPSVLHLMDNNLKSLKMDLIRKMLDAEFLSKMLKKMEVYYSNMKDNCDAQVVELFINAFYKLWSRCYPKKRANFVKAHDSRAFLEKLVDLSNSRLIRELIFDVNLETSREKKTEVRDLKMLIPRKTQPVVIFKPIVHPEPIEIACGRRPPNARWLQGRKYIFLIVNIPQQHSLKLCPVFVSSTSLHLNCQVQGEVIGFDIILYQSIDPNNCLVKITEHEIRLKIKKIDVSEHWPKLVRADHSPPWLAKDLEYLDYEDTEKKVGVEITEEAEEVSGFTLPSLEKASDEKVTKTINRYREICRRKMLRSGKKMVGKPPDIDAAAWVFANTSAPSFSKAVENGEDGDNKEEVGTELEQENDDDNISDYESSDDDFFDESESDDNIEVEPQSTKNPALEDCSDHYYHY